MKVAVIGTGYIGGKRVKALPKGVNLAAVCDVDTQKGKLFANQFNCRFEKDWRILVNNKEIDAVFICVTNNSLAKIANLSIQNKKHVLIEKPGAVNVKQISDTYQAYKKNPVVVMYGYNHRFHPSLQKAKQIVDSYKFGSILFIRARYGHGGRLGYEKEWRFQKRLSGGGELLDQGCHLIDLVNFFCGQMSQTTGLVTNLFWKTKLEDAAFFQLKNSKKQIADLSVTCIEWKNIFSFEIMMQQAKIEINGLGGSYGGEKLTLYKMRPKMGPPDTTSFKFEEKDNSWVDQNNIFFKKIRQKDYSDNSIIDALYVMQTIEKLYKGHVI